MEQALHYKLRVTAYDICGDGNKNECVILNRPQKLKRKKYLIGNNQWVSLQKIFLRMVLFVK